MAWSSFCLEHHFALCVEWSRDEHECNRGDQESDVPGLDRIRGNN